jgi:membrane associated rhomboid family serine protease
MSSHFFSPSHSPGLPRSRFYSPGGGYSGYRLQQTNNMAVLYTLMGTNITIFGYMLYVKQQATVYTTHLSKFATTKLIQRSTSNNLLIPYPKNILTTPSQGFQAPLIKFMQKMTLNLTDVTHGAYQQILTCCFTHLNFGHIFSNMFTVFFLGRFLASAPQITPLRYLTIALGSGISGSIGYLFNRSYQLTASNQTRDHNRCVGFSGAVMGISSVAACLYPTAKFAIYGIVPVPLWALVTFYAAYDGYYLNSADSRIGHAGHLGGLAFGIVYYVARLRGVRV